MTRFTKRPKVLLTILQALTILVMLAGTWIAYVLGILGVSAARYVGNHAPVGSLVMIYAALATVVGVSVCCYITLGSFLGLLQRMKRETAFTARNGKTLGRMAGCCAIAALILFLMMVYIGILNGLPDLLTMRKLSDFLRVLNYTISLLILPFAFSVIALLIQGVRLLMLRAIDLQQDQDLAV